MSCMLYIMHIIYRVYYILCIFCFHQGLFIRSLTLLTVPKISLGKSIFSPMFAASF